MLDPGGLVVLVVLLDKDGEGVRGLGCGGGGSSLGLGGHLLAIDHQLEPGGGTLCTTELWLRRCFTCHDSDRKLFYWYPSSCCGGLKNNLYFQAQGVDWHF